VIELFRLMRLVAMMRYVTIELTLMMTLLVTLMMTTMTTMLIVTLMLEVMLHDNLTAFYYNAQLC